MQRAAAPARQQTGEGQRLRRAAHRTVAKPLMRLRRLRDRQLENDAEHAGIGEQHADAGWRQRAGGVGVKRRDRFDPARPISSTATGSRSAASRRSRNAAVSAVRLSSSSVFAVRRRCVSASPAETPRPPARRAGAPRRRRRTPGCSDHSASTRAERRSRHVRRHSTSRASAQNARGVLSAGTTSAMTVAAVGCSTLSKMPMTISENAVATAPAGKKEQQKADADAGASKPAAPAAGRPGRRCRRRNGVASNSPPA